ncbi:hypothetical protein QYE76_010640 [Lolium multiflorum]|uniref:CCHC-type domain-containing protein n=1 Tax=Lolium multiflorum TaxID=4521 RepID=A0AAD8TXM2_LOLMU|nr:hypothetical protein QYE76_010640 [Lolium multiflorum]
MSITLGAATKLLDDMMINYSEWHTERAPQGKKVNSVEETSSLSDKIDVIMSMLVNGRSNVDPNNVPLASLVAQEENVDVNFIKNNNFNNNAYRNNSGNNYRPYPSANGNGYGNSYGNSYNNNRSVPSGLEAMLKEFISTQTAFNKSVEEKLDKIDIIASRVDRLASDVNLLKLKVMPNNDIDNKMTTTANAIQVRINENIRLMAELRARWDREENEKLAKENNVAKVWTITTISNDNDSHVAAPPTINGKIIGVGNVSTPSAKRTKLPEIAKTAETACDKTAEIFSNLGNNDPIAVAHNDLDFDDCHISEVIKFLQKLAKSPNASAINLAFTKHITNALIKAREEKLKLETSIPRKLEDGWEPIIKMKFNDFEYMASSINFNQFLEKEKLKSNGSNFTDWFRHVRIFLNGGNLQYVLDAPLGDPPAETETDEVKNVYMTRKTRYSQVQCAILCSLESDLQKRFEHHDPHELIKELKTIFETHAAVECYEASKHFFSCMMEEGSSISEHMLVMTGHAKKLSDLGIVIPNRLGINRVLQSLPPSYKNFVMNYNMQNMNKEFPELFGMLKAAEIEIKKEHQVLMVNKTTSFKKQGKSKGKNKKSGKKAATPPVKPKSGPKPDAECYYCKEKGHWKRNCSKYLADLKSGLVKKKKEVPENVPVPPTPATEEANDNDHETSNETATEPRRSTRDRATPDWYDPCLNVMIVDNNDEDPATYEEAMMSPDSNKWQEAMKSEMGSMYDNKVWTLVELPDSRKAVENKWIFKRKTDADGNITVYKARLVAKGFRQIQGVDYDETFSPVAKLKSVRILLAIAAFFDYEIWQMDVKTAFLNGDIEEELYMVQPKGFVDPKNADKVCKLQRSIYGLKQASRSWNRRFDKVIKDFGFIQCHGEACIYKKVSGSSVAFLILYVDDILLIGNDIELLSSVKGYLNNSFSMKDLGEASYILGIKIYRDRSRRLIGLSQSTYLDKILKKFRMDESKKGFLPMLPGKVLSKTQGPATAEERERMSQIPYASAVGSIMYAMLCTRPDIAHAVSLTSRYQSDPGMEHWTAVKNILKYLKRTKDMFLCYGGDQELVVTSYTDASWNTDPDDSKSQSGYVFILNGAAVSWASSKQCTVAKSSTESEYIAASEASSEAVWMKRFIVELGVVPSALDPFVIYCDNMGAIANAQEPRSHKRLKHIKLRYHSIREYIEDGEVKICKVHTDLNVADPLTKALPRAKHDQHQNAMGVRYITM